MPSTDERGRRSVFTSWPARLLLTGFLLALILFWPRAQAQPAAQERLSVYAPQGTFSVPLQTLDGRDYVSLLDLLTPLGQTSARQDGRKWKLRFNDTEAEFQDGKARIRVGNRNLEMSAPFRLQNGSGLVPLAGSVPLWSPLLREPVELHESARRLFLGGVAVFFTVRLVRAPSDSVILTFSAPVNPSIATEPGRLRMTFAREPVLHPSSNTISFDDKTFTALAYHETAGVAELAINTTVPLLARFSADRKTITVSPVVEITAQAKPQPSPPAVPATTAPSAPATAVPPGIPSQPAPIAAPPPPASPPPVVVVDASHGGTERGAALSETVLEKDVALSIAIRLHTDLEARGLRTALLRNADSTLSLEQRAILANTSRARFYISLHAGSLGTGVRLFTAMLPPVSPPSGPFFPWTTAQAPFLAASQSLSGAIAAELGKVNVAARQMPAPLPPLSNIAAAAVAVEVVPTGGDVNQLTSPAYQEQIAAAIAAGIFRAQQGATP